MSGTPHSLNKSVKKETLKNRKQYPRPLTPRPKVGLESNSENKEFKSLLPYTCVTSQAKMFLKVCRFHTDSHVCALH